MKARVKWLEKRTMVGESGSGHAIVMDGAPQSGGSDLGIRPMEMMLLGMGGCTMFDVVMILERGREKVTDCEIELEAERADTDPKVFTQVKMIYTFRGHDLNRDKVERAVKLSAEKYCSASKMIQMSAEVTHEIRIEPAH